MASFRWQLLSLLALVVPIQAQQPPKAMTKIEVVLEGPAIPAGSFATKPRVIYRSGTKYCRVEESPDAEHGIHGLLIDNEPDAWMVNLIDKTAKHMKDPGPSFNCRLPIFPAIDPSLEFGYELEYFRAKRAVSTKGVELQGKSTTVYKVEINGDTLALFTYGTPERPMAAVSGQNGGEIYWYKGHGDLPFQASLFAKPDGVKIQEQ